MDLSVFKQNFPIDKEDKTVKKRMFSFLLALLLLLSLVPSLPIVANAATVLTETEFANKIAVLKKEYPDGKFWSNENGTVQAGIDKGTSLAGSSSCGSTSWTEKCGTFKISGQTAWQCHGFALLLAHKVFGSNANNWAKYTSKDREIYAGDVVRVDVNGNGVNENATDHTIFVYKVTDSKVYYADCNSAGPCKIRWGEMTRSELTKKLLYVRHLKENLLKGTGSETPVLSVKFDANGGTIANAEVYAYTYKVIDAEGLNMRSGAGTNYSKVTALTKGTTFNVNISDMKTADGYTWGKTTVGSNTGWVVISRTDWVTQTATLRGSKYYLNGSAIYKTDSSSVFVQNMTYGQTYTGGLTDATDTFYLFRDGYNFLGWSLAKEGAEIFGERRGLKPEEIVPDLKNGSKTVTVYAIWEESSPANITIFYNANGATGEMDTVNTTKGSSVTLAQNQFVNEGYAFAGWTLQRQDGLWYTDENAWYTEDVIAAQGYNKQIFGDGATISLSAPLVTLSEDHSYTLHAVWRSEKAVYLSAIGTKQLYYVGDTLDTSGICLMVQYVDGSCKTVTDGFTCFPMALTNEGEQTVTVTYGTLSATFTVQVTAAKEWKENAKANKKQNAYLLPNTSAQTFYYTFANDELTILCKDGDFYLGYYPWQATAITQTNGVLVYVPVAAVTLNSGVTVPDAADYYTINKIGIVNTSANVYHRTNTDKLITASDADVTVQDVLTAGDKVKVLFEMSGYYCIQTSQYTGYVAKSAITLEKELSGIYVDEAFNLTVKKDQSIDTSALAVMATSSDNSSVQVTDYEITLPNTAVAGLQYATIGYGGFVTFVPVNVTIPKITGISVNTKPNKEKYLPTETLDLTGLQLDVAYEDGSVETISQGYSVVNYDFSELGYQPVTVAYMGIETYVTVMVYEPLVLEILDTDGYQGQTVNVPVIFRSNVEETDVYSFSANISYDKVKLQYRGFTVSENLDATKLIVDPSSQGGIAIAYTSDAVIPMNMILLELQFNIIAEETDVACAVNVKRCALYDAGSWPYEVINRNGTVSNLGMVCVDYDAGEGTNVPEAVRVKYGVQVAISKTIPVWGNNVFLGWSTVPGGEAVDYKAGDIVDCVQSITLYAVWQAHIHDYEENPAECSICGHVRASSEITSVVLRPTSAGIYFKSSFSVDADLQVDRKGIVVSTSNALPVADNSDPSSLYTVSGISVLVNDILKGGNTDVQNAKNAIKPIYARTYILLKDGTYIYGDVVTVDLRQVVEGVDANLDALNSTQKNAITAMYETYRNVMQFWDLPKTKEKLAS